VGLALDRPAFLREHAANAIAKVTLDFDGILNDRAACTARAFQLADELLQEGLISRQIVDDGHGFSRAACPFDPQFGDDPRRKRFVADELVAAFAVARGPAARRAHPARTGRVHGSAASIRHAFQNTGNGVGPSADTVRLPCLSGDVWCALRQMPLAPFDT